jgi:hypothetical protein
VIIPGERRIHATNLSESSSGDARQTFGADDGRVDAGGCRDTTARS